ncbi:pyruvate formate lyase activating enzyme [Catenaria anguillulae PL171]|uniref:Pyruvate formate lyase activating enzyme n=1 Tax=Catenaria anguillulae PL171 TaxID=765915 RepID=A0A1Y2I3B8_9FUNG|nr:pyruvate formate lyase activating enzyme [Catenaria anguillulae PL171]
MCDRKPVGDIEDISLVRRFFDAVSHSMGNLSRDASHDDLASQAHHELLEFKGYVHSVESLACLEGPGNRFLAFWSGCKARCTYCSNPDTWEITAGKETKVGELVEKVGRMVDFYRPNGGGVTVTGGEPLVQYKFWQRFCMRLNRYFGLHTCIETTGQGTRRAWDTVLPHTDLALVCLKHPKPEGYRFITVKKDLDTIPWWCRYVVIPEWTDKDEDLDALIEICKGSPMCKRLDLLPYHTLGVNKWEEMNLEYPMKDMQPPTKERMQYVAKRLRDGFAGTDIIVTGDDQ